MLSVQVFGQRVNIHAQSDSLVIEAASDRQQTRDILIDQVQVSTSYELLPQIDSLELRIAELDELTKQTLDSRLDYSYYGSLKLRCERQKNKTVPLQTSL